MLCVFRGENLSSCFVSLPHCCYVAVYVCVFPSPFNPRIDRCWVSHCCAIFDVVKFVPLSLIHDRGGREREKNLYLYFMSINVVAAASEAITTNRDDIISAGWSSSSSSSSSERRIGSAVVFFAAASCYSCCCCSCCRTLCPPPRSAATSSMSIEEGNRTERKKERKKEKKDRSFFFIVAVHFCLRYEGRTDGWMERAAALVPSVDSPFVAKRRRRRCSYSTATLSLWTEWVRERDGRHELLLHHRKILAAAAAASGFR